MSNSCSCPVSRPAEGYRSNGILCMPLRCAGFAEPPCICISNYCAFGSLHTCKVATSWHRIVVQHTDRLMMCLFCRYVYLKVPIWLISTSLINSSAIKALDTQRPQVGIYLNVRPSTHMQSRSFSHAFCSISPCQCFLVPSEADGRDFFGFRHHGPYICNLFVLFKQEWSCIVLLVTLIFRFPTVHQTLGFLQIFIELSLILKPLFIPYVWWFNYLTNS